MVLLAESGSASPDGYPVHTAHDCRRASRVLFFREINRFLLNGMLGFAAGVMIGFAVMMTLDVALG